VLRLSSTLTFSIWVRDFSLVLWISFFLKKQKTRVPDAIRINTSKITIANIVEEARAITAIRARNRMIIMPIKMSE